MERRERISTGKGGGGEDLSEEREKIPGREKALRGKKRFLGGKGRRSEKALGGKGGKELNRERWEKILARKREKILGAKGERISTKGKDLGEDKGEDLRGETP